MRPDPGPARDWLRQELGHPEYQRSLVQRIQGWLADRLDRIANGAAHASGFSTLTSLVLLIAFVLVVLLVVRHLRVETRVSSADDGSLAIGASVTAGEHRARAEAALAAGRHEEAVVEAVRALTRALVERTVLPDDPGTTAHEMSVAAAAAFPAYDGRLRAAADLFDAVQYGDRPATADSVRELLSLDTELARVQPRRGVTTSAAVAPR